MNKRLTAKIMLILTAMIWGFAFVAQSTALNHISSFTFNGIRFFIGAISLIPVILIFERANIKENFKTTVKYGIITGLVLCIASDLQQFSMVYMEIDSKAGFITGIYTVIVPIYGIFMKKKTSFNVWIGAFLALAGLYLVSVVGMEKLEIGDLICFMGSFFWALHIVVIDKFVDKVSPIMYSAVQFLTCAIVNIILMLVFETDAFSMTNILAAGTSILYAGVMSSGVAYTFQVLSQKNCGPTESAIIFSLESVFACVGCMVILGERMPPISIFGCCFIFAGIILSQLDFNKKQ